MSIALLFPGQGSQALRMGCHLSDVFAAARDVLAEVDDALGQNLSQIMREGPEDLLTLTENAQPALMAVSIATMRTLKADFGIDVTAADYVAGHSLGEYSALCAAGAFSLPDTARLLKLRGQSMQKAVPVGRGAMAALLGAELEQAQAIAADAAQGEVCAVANDNASGQVVLSGSTEAIDRAIAIAAERGLKRSVRLPVSAPFHCPLMQPAADAMAEALETVAVSAPVVPVVANVTASAVSDPADICRLLVEQVTGMVRWRESVLYMKDQGVDQLVELGAGKVLAGLAKRIDKEVGAVSVGTPADVEAFLKTL